MLKFDDSDTPIDELESPDSDVVITFVDDPVGDPVLSDNSRVVRTQLMVQTKLSAATCGKNERNNCSLRYLTTYPAAVQSVLSNLRSNTR